LEKRVFEVKNAVFGAKPTPNERWSMLEAQGTQRGILAKIEIIKDLMRIKEKKNFLNSRNGQL
jgi:hypothetical protein